MKKTMVVMLGLMALTVLPVRADEMSGMKMDNSKMSAEYCAKHCNAVELRKEVISLEKAIATDKAAIKAGGGGEKVTTLMARKDQLKKKIDEAMKVLESLKADADKAEAELNQLGNK